jgi:hypothetical protein
LENSYQRITTKNNRYLKGEASDKGAEPVNKRFSLNYTTSRKPAGKAFLGGKDNSNNSGLSYGDEDDA